jgi:hypothetical protein
MRPDIVPGAICPDYQRLVVRVVANHASIALFDS